MKLVLPFQGISKVVDFMKYNIKIKSCVRNKNADSKKMTLHHPSRMPKLRVIRKCWPIKASRGKLINCEL